MSHGRLNASTFAPQDFISNMPDNVVTNILDRLPLQHSVRTGILSKSWRFKWTLLSQLVFDEQFYRHLLQTKCQNNFVKIISRLLLHLNGVITKFVLFIHKRASLMFDDEDIAHWIFSLSRKGVKDVTIWKTYDPPRIKLPTHLFSCSELKHLELHYCCFDPPASFHGFPNLLSLSLWHVEFEGINFGELFSRCPRLEIFKLCFLSSSSKVQLLDFAKLGNLKELYLRVCNLEESMITSSSIFELLSFLPKLQELKLNFISDNLMCKSFTEDGARKRFPFTFPCLKTLKLSNIDLCSGVMFSFAIEIIRSSPNLQTLAISAGFKRDVDPRPAIWPLEVDYNTMGLLQLRSVVFVCFKGSEEEVCLIKYLLACSPYLKKIVIYSNLSVETDEELKFAKKLLKLHRASSLAEICLF